MLARSVSSYTICQVGTCKTWHVNTVTGFAFASFPMSPIRMYMFIGHASCGRCGWMRNGWLFSMNARVGCGRYMDAYIV
ncbi:hypothetical protein BRADI_3g15301v3 [Brachypodium distachyon]|uniref:Uncharacterized protein n=1 Tax=Brachypodium distachyon TaxID=15368 RepID=A0A2K2CX94_BRADI|nr:hypothetical protein BRADI_3g15301v3 [Brachypodium distachyon]